MAKTSTFDITSSVDLQEVDNAVNQARKEVQQRYDGSLAAQRAAVRVGQLEEMFAAKEYRTALFYFRLKAYDSAILSLRHVVATYPRTHFTTFRSITAIE